MTKQELDKLKAIIVDKFYFVCGSNPASITAAESEKPAGRWQKFCEEMGLKRMNSLVAFICHEADGKDISIKDLGRTIILTPEQAKKILVLGL